jgi:hypothetical protein
MQRCREAAAVLANYSFSVKTIAMTYDFYSRLIENIVEVEATTFPKLITKIYIISFA